MKVKEPSSFRPSSSEMCNMLEKANLEIRGFQKEVVRKSFQKPGRAKSDFEVRIMLTRRITSSVFIYLFFFNIINWLHKPMLLTLLNITYNSTSYTLMYNTNFFLLAVSTIFHCATVRLWWARPITKFMYDTRPFHYPKRVTRRKSIFVYFFTELKTCHLSNSIYKSWLYRHC